MKKLLYAMLVTALLFTGGCRKYHVTDGDFRSMEIGDTIKLSGRREITCVPGGWVYSETNGLDIESVFIPKN